MNDIVARMRCRTIMVHRGHGDVSDIPDDECIEAADAIEQRDAIIARLKQERDDARAEAYDLKYAAADGEDVPGSANAVTVADVERWRREQEARATTAERERDKAREALKLTLAALRDVFPTEKIRTAIIAARLVLTQKAETE